MYKLIIFFLNYNALEDISQCRFHEYELQQQTSSQYTVNTFVDFSGGWEYTNNEEYESDN